MIGHLKGTLLEKQPPWLLLEVAGVGYELQVPMTTFYQLPLIGTTVELHTHFVVREDAQQLFGFADKTGRELFRELIKVNGVGPKMALAMLSALETGELIESVLNNRIATLVKVPGIGQKTAERLIIELRDRLQRWSTNNAEASVSSTESTPSPLFTASTQADAESALQALGYKPQEAERAIATAMKETGTHSTEDLIRLALKRMVTR
jgi:Holliday junction DNA helicase RuvA